MPDKQEPTVTETKKVLPPTYLLAFVLAMMALRLFLPGRQIMGLPWALLGLLPAVLGLALSIVADQAFKRHGTTVKPFEESTALVTSGAYAISRHPMYLGFTLILVGLAIIMGALMPFLAVPLFVVLMELVFIRTEEQMMEARFNQSWRDYKKKVRRWL